MRHTVDAITFVPRTNHGPMRCSCGWEGEFRTYPAFGNGGDTFSEHRRAAGAKVAYLGDSLRTSSSPAFQPPMKTCRRGHEGPWRPRQDGRRECVVCVRELQRESRKRAKVA